MHLFPHRTCLLVDAYLLAPLSVRVVTGKAATRFQFRVFRVLEHEICPK